MTKARKSHYGLDSYGFVNLQHEYWNLSVAELVEHIVRNNEGVLSDHGAVIVETGKFTGRSPKDKYIVRQGKDEYDRLILWGETNQLIDKKYFDQILTKVINYFAGKAVYIQDMVVGADPEFQLPIRIISEKAWASLFSLDLFRKLSSDELPDHRPEFTLIHCPNFQVDPSRNGIRSGTFIILDFVQKIILIGGTQYAGEIKKAIFSAMNYLLPQKDVLPMHCSANIGKAGDVALFFGLSGTGKTTLSSDLERNLIGDDEHGWSEKGIFNFEGGCYAKTIRLRKELEPLIWNATQHFGTILENVIYDPITRELDFDNDHLTENTRAAYPLEFINNYMPGGCAGNPSHIFFLTADAFGVLPPISKLSIKQAMYYFLLGYTAKIAGTETGLGSEPIATFSACFGAPFLPLPPLVYAKLLGRRIQSTNAQVWLVNTGWTGGSFGIGHRINLNFTRAMIHAVLSDQLADVEYQSDPYFGLLIPTTCSGVPTEILNPIRTWDNQQAYGDQANNLAFKMKQNFLECNGSENIASLLQLEFQ